jgi:hypothetical protein
MSDLPQAPANPDLIQELIDAIRAYDHDQQSTWKMHAAKKARAALEDALSPPAAAQPVAWRWRYKSPVEELAWLYGDGKPFVGDDVQLQPLYAASVASCSDETGDAAVLAAKIDLSAPVTPEGQAAIMLSKPEWSLITQALRVRSPSKPWECAGRKQSLPEPGECNWPDCGCDPHATKVIEALIEQGWEGPKR